MVPITDALIGGNILTYDELPTPAELKQQLPLDNTSMKMIQDSREQIKAVLDGKDNRKIVIAGPCSIFDAKDSYEYAGLLKELSDSVRDRILIVMRAYVEKPRTISGWAGLIEDPYLDGSDRKNEGLFAAREILSGIVRLGMPVATEFLNVQTPIYISDLVSYATIGARTCESQDHKKMASGLPMPVGIKNSCDGRLDAAAYGVKVASSGNTYRNINENGRVCRLATRGNAHSHVILRGGANGPNHKEEHIKSLEHILQKQMLPFRVVIDCSHGNSGKDPYRQREVLMDCLENSEHMDRINGFMIESNINEGKQEITRGRHNLKKGVSVTDACRGWKDTRPLVLEVYDILRMKKNFAYKRRNQVSYHERAR